MSERTHMRSELNADVTPAAVGEFPTPRIGKFELNPPVILAPMAGVTNAPFRRLCREMGGALYVSEMVNARALAEGHRRSLKLASFTDDEYPRSLQIYGTDPESVSTAIHTLVSEDRVDHIDMNFGCPAPKVTRNGGGAAVPARPRLFSRIVSAAVSAAGDIPVTVKFRKGIDDTMLTSNTAGRIAEAEGAAAVALHARTAYQLYSGSADWNAVGELKSVVTTIPVFGNGDIFEPWDALRMMRMTGCDGVVVGRGCLGRPWLFRDLNAVFAGDEPPPPPTVADISATMTRHATLLHEWFGGQLGIQLFRKHANWYLAGLPVGRSVRAAMNTVDHPTDIARILAPIDQSISYPLEALRVVRSHSGGPRPVALPQRFLEHLDSDLPPGREADVVVSGG